MTVETESRWPAARWIPPLIFTGVLTAFVAVATGRFAFRAVERPPLLTHPWLGPVSLLLAGVALLLAAAWWAGLRRSFDTARLLPLLCLVGIVLNTWWMGPGALLRTPGNTLDVLFKQPQDAFGNAAVYVRIADRFAGHSFEVSADVVSRFALQPWELQAHGRASHVTVDPETSTISDADKARLLGRPHEVVRVQALGNKDGRYFSYFRRFVLVDGDGHDRDPIAVVASQDEAFIVPQALLQPAAGGR